MNILNIIDKNRCNFLENAIQFSKKKKKLIRRLINNVFSYLLFNVLLDTMNLTAGGLYNNVLNLIRVLKKFLTLEKFKKIKDH